MEILNMDIRTILCLLVTLIPVLTFAQNSPVGEWQTYDLKNTPRSIVRISENKEELTGTIIKSYKPGTCEACQGSRHNKPLVGMQIIWGLIKSGETWKNGHILDVDSGKVYNCRLSVSDDNKILYFSPYIGSPIFGVTLKWKRV